jgi:glycosyltransferase involved in cell wall biosynthesis
VTVVITAFQRKGFLRSAVASVVRQGSDALPVQVVVVKDFANPSIDAYLREMRVDILEPMGSSLSGWIAQALSVAKAPVLAFLDDDDLFLPGRIAALDQRFQEEPRAGYYRNAIVKFSAAGDGGPTIPEGPSSPAHWVEDTAKNPRSVEAMWVTGAAFNHSSIAVRRELVEAFRSELEQLSDGYSTFLFYAALDSSYGLIIDPRRWTAFRVHSGNESPLAGAPRRERWERTFRLAGARAHDAAVILDLVRRRRPGIWTRPLERVRARNEMYLSWISPRPSRRRRARELAGLLRTEGLRSLPGDWVDLALGGLAVARPRWVPMRA